MPITASLDRHKGFLRTTVTGTVTIGEMAQHIAAVRTSASYQYPGLVDARGVVALTFGRRDLTQFVHYMSNVLGPRRPAPRAVVVEGLVHLGLARLVAALAVRWMRVGVFDDISCAEDWLTGVSNPS